MNYFSEKELSCTCCGEYNFDDGFLLVLNQIRERCGFPLVVTSAYRCPNHPIEAAKENPGEGEHCTGMAIDIGVSHDKAHILLQVALSMGIPRIGVNQKGAGRFIHLGMSPDFPYPTVWSY